MFEITRHHLNEVNKKITIASGSAKKSLHDKNMIQLFIIYKY